MIQSPLPMTHKMQNLSFGLCLVFSLVLFLFVFPAQLKKFLPQKTPGAQSSQPDKGAVPSFVPFSSDALKIKSSGEDPLPPDEEMVAYLSVREEFERRFGHSLEEAFTTHEPVHYPFTVPEPLREMVSFWIHVFGHYGKDHYVFHHKDQVSIVYSAINLEDLDPLVSGLMPEESEELKRHYLAEEMARVRKMLKGLARNLEQGAPLTEEESRLARLFANNTVSLLQAVKAESIRIQGGFAHRFQEAIIRSGQYMAEMENIFSMKGLPVELTRLPFIESAFKIKAVSPAKAVGLWQFIPDTGRRYLKIDDITDERKDPILATYAAAHHLEREYKLLGSWPLAINSYNTGPQRMLKAKQQLKTDDIVTVIREFKYPGYEFYSRNYYPEFLAALHVYENQEEYFGPIEKMPPLEYDIFIPKHSLNFADLMATADVSPEVMERLNPALEFQVLEGQKLLPQGYFARVPREMGQLFAASALNTYKVAMESKWHIVQEGETLTSVAEQYEIPLEVLAEENHYLPNESLVSGTVLTLPRHEGVAQTPEER